MEEYRIIEGMSYHYVSDDGNVKSADRVVMTKGGWTQTYYGKVLKPYRNKHRNNYEQVNICEDGVAKNYKVHQLVAKAFPEICGEWFDGCEIDHINGITTDNRAVNLRVTNKKGNMNNPVTKENCSKAWTDERREKISKRMKENNPTRQEGYWTEERRKRVGEFCKLTKSKAVNQYTADGEFIAQYSSVAEAARSVNGSPGNIVSCITGKQITSYKSKWKYA